MIIKLKKEIGPNLIVRLDAENLFKQLEGYSTNIIMDFSGIEFINRSFAQEYLNRKFSVGYEIDEINITMQSLENILVTSPLLPDLDEFQSMLKDIWASKWITNNGSFHKQLEQALAEYLKIKISKITMFFG